MASSRFPATRRQPYEGQTTCRNTCNHCWIRANRARIHDPSPRFRPPPPPYQTYNYREWYLQGVWQVYEQTPDSPILTILLGLSDTYISNYVIPNTGEDFETAKARIISSLSSDPSPLEIHTAVLIESYTAGDCPSWREGQCYILEITLWAISAQVLPLLGSTADYADVTADDYEPEWADWSIPRPSATGMPQPTPTPQPSLALKYDPAGDDRDCDNFSTWQEAQAFFLATQNDSHGLDTDGNGIACEDLAGAPEAEVVEVEVIVTPTPAPTPRFPTTIDAGTYRVNMDIAVGLYKGIVTERRFSSCTWKRWRKHGDLEYEAELDIHFDEGYQFYVRVLETDYSLETNCQLTRITDFTRPPASGLPNIIEPGMYLVGVEIKSGIYEGVVPSEDFSFCSWARHADFTGAFNETIDRGYESDDGTTFSILVASSDYGLDTNCRLTFVQ